MSNVLVELVSTWGLAAVFVTMTLESAGIPIPSELVVPLAGALASGALGSSHLSLFGVVAAASAGNLAGSMIAYVITARFGENLILGPGRRVGLSAGHLRLAHRVFDRWGIAAVFAGRLLPVIRTYISFPAGLSRVKVLPFAIATILGAIPWNFGLAYAGLKLGQNYPRVAEAMGPFTLPLAGIVAILLALAYYYGRRLGHTEPVA